MCVSRLVAFALRTPIIAILGKEKAVLRKDSEKRLNMEKTWNVAWYRRRGSNPHAQRTTDFESIASAIPPLRH